MRRALFAVANVLAAVVLVLPAVDPGRDLTPVLGVLAVALAAFALAWQWQRCVGRMALA